ncbi:MAG: nicotinate-nucleotide--dimethylbenzimidazole phosphoribosyltransferase [Hydrogenophilus thermoluteolus]|uniref:nicotinate-nucleotide--dimethylbenzimidazole phosphoribosyltransferase n=1 Tax=Hydrogenophilus thiooxidans TaxID=2820326 RepID=UPI001C21D8F9|nr:nicotinate-nucleotide--dimethylbenzimidazole phosphoribosyltransferase [Hydrogenophilus thiooxidans]
MRPTPAPIDETLAPKLQHKIDRKTKPLGALGRLEAVALQLGLIQNRLDPSAHHPYALVFAADHGLTRTHPVSAYPRDVTWQMVRNFLAGGAAINVFCRTFGIPLKVVDAGVDHLFTPHPDLIDAKLAFGSNDAVTAPALGLELAHRAVATGAEIVSRLPDSLDVLILGEMGIGNTATATLLLHCFTGLPLATLVGRGTGLDDAGVARKRAVLEQALARGGTPSDPWQILAEYGGLEIAQMAGAMLAASERRVAVLVDGFIATAAAVAALAITPEIRPYLIFTHCSNEQGHRAVLDHLGVSPLLDLDLRLGEGTGAALAYPLVQAAAAFLNEMASFESAGVADRA